MLLTASPMGLAALVSDGADVAAELVAVGQVGCSVACGCADVGAVLHRWVRSGR